MTDFFDKQYEVLMAEWSYTQAAIRAHDEIIFKIRSWAVTLASAALGYAYVNKDARLCLYIGLPILMIWIIDGMFKSFQRNFIFRDREIRTYFESSSFEADFEARKLKGIAVSRPYPIREREFGWKWSGIKLHFSSMLLRNVSLTYLTILVIQFGTYLFLT